ncbi:hypothetical protein niasHT_010200 [Heterodera trifolii]|uniref:B30.2/SPRY domain-containing protein n=1 Tax=Heterodera trifolii TaxID=157864 RepID=A0ABD2MFJ7_9BILA
MSKRRRDDAFIVSSAGGGKSGQSEGGNEPSVAEHLQQQQQRLFEKGAKMGIELSVTKLELENMALKAELKQREMAEEINALKAKVAKMEEQKEDEKKKYATLDQFSQLQNGLKNILEKVSELDKVQKQKRKVTLNFEGNYWDATACHENLEIIGSKSLNVNYKRKFSDYWCSVFAKYPIWMNKDSSDIFYFEISVESVKKKNDYISFGFAVKQQTNLDGSIIFMNGTYAYESDGEIRINGEGKGKNAKYSYRFGYTVGIGINLITRQLFFTRNGQLLDSSNFFVSPSFFSHLFPFVSLDHSGDEIKANFGNDKFKFDLALL